MSGEAIQVKLFLYFYENLYENDRDILIIGLFSAFHYPKN
jgi:hypothetical protein